MGPNPKLQDALDRAAQLKREAKEAENTLNEIRGTGGDTERQAEENLRQANAAYEQSLRDISDAKHGK